MLLNVETFGYLGEKEVKQFILSNDNGLCVKIINYGGIITNIEMPDTNGNVDNIVCGFDDLQSYLSKEYLGNYPYFGAIIGRNANRIKDGNLVIEGKKYQLAKNNGKHHLHGGNSGFDKKLWKFITIDNGDETGVELSYFSHHLEENYPGNLSVICTYTLNNNNELKIEFKATTDKTTIVNLTNHTYFNLTGIEENILGHELKLNASCITETGKNLIPTGRFLSIKDTLYDFSDFKRLKDGIEHLPGGYDDNFVINGEKGSFKYAGTLRENKSKRQVEIFTDQPGMQVYTGYWIPRIVVNNKKKYGRFSGIALETQHFPDAVHNKNFPSTILKPDEEYRTKTVFKFSNY